MQSDTILLPQTWCSLIGPWSAAYPLGTCRGFISTYSQPHGLGSCWKGEGMAVSPQTSLTLCFSIWLSLIQGSQSPLAHKPKMMPLKLKNMVVWGRVFLTGGPPSVLFCFRHLWCWTNRGPFSGLVPLGPCGYSVLSTGSEEQPSKCLSTHILCTVDFSPC